MANNEAHVAIRVTGSDDALEWFGSELLAAGASIESGPLSLVVRREYARRLTHAKIHELFGDEGFDWILSEIEPTHSLILTRSEEHTSELQ